MCVCVGVCAHKCSAWELDKAARTLGSGVTGYCQLPKVSECQEPNSGSLQKKYMLLTTEPFFQPPPLPCLSACHVYVGVHSGQKRALYPLELEMQTVVSCSVMVLGKHKHW